MYLFDSDILVEYFRGNPSITKRIHEIYLKNTGIFTTYINICELFRGAFLSDNTEKEVQKINAIVLTLNVSNLDITSCRIYGEDYSYLKKEGIMTQQADL